MRNAAIGVLVLVVLGGMSRASATLNLPGTCGWVTQTGATFAGTNVSLWGAAADGASDVWAVGREVNSSGTDRLLAEHWDGTSWSFILPPERFGISSTFSGVALISPKSGWAVGEDRGTMTKQRWQTLIEEWNGTTWGIIGSPNVGGIANDNVLNSVSAWGYLTAFSVGYTVYRTQNVYQTLVERWDGKSWTVVPSPNVSGSLQDFLFGVAGYGPNDVWTVGEANVSGSDLAFSEHWNGKVWTLVTMPQPSPSIGTEPSAVTAVAANDAWAVGGTFVRQGLTNTLVYHWNGTSWTVIPSPNVAGAVYNFLYAVKQVSANDVWAAGAVEMTTRGPLSTLVEHWNGTSWQIETTQNPSSGNDQFEGIAAANPPNVWAVGQQGTVGSLVEAYCR
jgi:hypothetical protein